MPQPLLPFDAPPADPLRLPGLLLISKQSATKPDQKTLDAIQRLQEWLADLRTGKTSSLGQETLDALDKALVEGAIAGC